MTDSEMNLQNFCCLNCGNATLKMESNQITCQNCQHHYPIQANIPVLVHDWTRHQKQIDEAQNLKPGWYVQEHVDQQTTWSRHLLDRQQYIEAIIQQYLQDNDIKQVKNLLDIGCGDGHHLTYLKKYSQNIFGSDYNLLRLMRAKQLHSEATIFLADILKYPIQAPLFDIVFFNHVIEHIEEDTLALKKIFEAMKSGGLLIVGTPNEGAFWWQLAYKLQPDVLRGSDHVQFYTMDALVNKIEGAGFHLQDKKYIGWGVPHWSLDLRLRQNTLIDSLFQTVGSRVIPSQSTSLYVIAVKQ